MSLLLVIACDKREAFVQGEAKQSISSLVEAWIASLRSQ
jgi:hypothetical protein